MPKMIEDKEHFAVVYEFNFGPVAEYYDERDRETLLVDPEGLGDDSDAMVDAIGRVMDEFRIYQPHVGVSSWEWPLLTFEDMRWRTMEEIKDEINPAIERVLLEIYSEYGATPDCYISVYDENMKLVDEWNATS